MLQCSNNNFEVPMFSLVALYLSHRKQVAKAPVAIVQQVAVAPQALAPVALPLAA
jgi:hypothetical protein